MICKTCGKDIPDYTQHFCPGKDQDKGSYSTQPKQMEKINKCGCPHSNVKPYLNSGTRHKLWIIHCKSCNCEMYFYETESEAIEAWNTAHPDYEQQLSDLTAAKEQAERERDVALKALRMSVKIHEITMCAYCDPPCKPSKDDIETAYNHYLEKAKNLITKAKEE